MYKKENKFEITKPTDIIPFLHFNSVLAEKQERQLTVE